MLVQSRTNDIFKKVIAKNIDHIIYAVQDLNTAILEFEEKLGVRPIFGGYHKSFGTKNALIYLGDSCYLELLAADESNTAIAKPRWMGIDLLQKNQITRWALKSNTLENDSALLKKIDSKMGNIQSGSRNMADGGVLQWDLIMPLPKPQVELVPFMLDWSKSKMHPTNSLPTMDCKLIELYGSHPTPEKFELIFEQLDIDFHIKTSNDIKLTALIKCPKGQIEI